MNRLTDYLKNSLPQSVHEATEYVQWLEASARELTTALARERARNQTLWAVNTALAVGVIGLAMAVIAWSL